MVGVSSVPIEGRLVIVAGGGHFGAKAAEYAKGAGARVVILDTDPDCAASWFANWTFKTFEDGTLFDLRGGSAALFVQDAVDSILALLRSMTPDYIAPAVPGHLAGWVVERWLRGRGLEVKPASEAAGRVAAAMPDGTVLLTDAAKGVVITSHMPQGSQCKVPCRQPPDRCATTGRAKAGPMHRLLAKAAEENADLSRVLVSRLLGPEAGCFTGQELASLIADAARMSPPYTLAVGTSCECHGIMNIFRVTGSSAK